jgi:general secretion pathway protein G
MLMDKFARNRSSGFTLMELLIVITIIGLLMAASVTNWFAQLQKSFDSKRKADLYKIKNAFNEYYNDFGSYPGTTILNSCGGSVLSNQGLRSIPCDPESKKPYIYENLIPGDTTSGFRIYTTLKVKADPDIERLGCNPTCRAPTCATCNYGLAEGGSVSQ